MYLLCRSLDDRPKNAIDFFATSTVFDQIVEIALFSVCGFERRRGRVPGAGPGDAAAGQVQVGGGRQQPAGAVPAEEGQQDADGLPEGPEMPVSRDQIKSCIKSHACLQSPTCFRDYCLLLAYELLYLWNALGACLKHSHAAIQIGKKASFLHSCHTMVEKEECHISSLSPFGHLVISPPTHSRHHHHGHKGAIQL